MIECSCGYTKQLGYINEVQSKVVVIFDNAYEVLKNCVSETAAKHFVVASPGDMLPFPLKTAYKLKVKSPQLDGGTFICWKSFIRAGIGTKVITVKKTAGNLR